MLPDLDRVAAIINQNGNDRKRKVKLRKKKQSTSQKVLKMSKYDQMLRTKDEIMKNILKAILKLLMSLI